MSTTTLQLYERNMRTLVMPAIGNLPLREIGVARCDQLLKQLNKRSYSRAKHARVALRVAFGLAVRHEVLPRNPMDHVARLTRQTSTPDALTPVEVTAIRAAIAVWEAGRAISGPKPDGQLGAIVEVMLGTSARIGEVLAIRRREVDITSAVLSIRIAQRELCVRITRGSLLHHVAPSQSHSNSTDSALTPFDAEMLARESR